jgi:hypothetical protein
MSLPGFTAEAVFCVVEDSYRSPSPAKQTLKGRDVVPQSWTRIGVGIIYGLVHPLLGLLAGLACENAGG